MSIENKANKFGGKTTVISYGKCCFVYFILIVKENQIIWIFFFILFIRY